MDDSPRLRWAAALGASSVLLFGLRFLFVALQSHIVAGKPPVDPSVITAWARWAAVETDGLELPIASAGMFAFLGLTGAVALYRPSARRKDVMIAASLLGLLMAIVTVSRTRSIAIKVPSDPVNAVFMLVSVAAFLGVVHLIVRFAGRKIRLAAICVCGVVLAAGIVLSLPEAFVVDYCYYIGPALKHLQGNRFGSFYMQYDLFGTLLFEGLMRLKLRLHQMQLVLALLLAAWYGLYWLLIRRLFRDRSIGAMLLAALVVVRFLSIDVHPAFTPQVLPHRLDMWVPLVLAASYWGLSSAKTAIAFATSYALDSTFGFLAAGIYVSSVLAVAIAEREPNEKRKALARAATLAAPIALVAIGQKLVFGSVVSPAASYYLDLQMGFLPISPKSLFWPVALLLGWAVATFVVHRDRPSSRWGLLICLFALAQLTYFFGRSHDNNLLNISAVWLFAIFLAIDQATELGVFGPPFGAMLVLVGVLCSSHQSMPKIVRMTERVKRGVWIEPHLIERQVEMYRSVASPKMMPLDLADAYYNYRLGLPQRGFFAPFNANVFVDQTAIFIDDVLGTGVSPVFFLQDDLMKSWIGDLNRSPALKARGHQFVGYQYASGFVGVRRGP